MFKALINSGREVNAMQPSFARKFGVRIRKTDISAQKVDGSRLQTFGIVIASFLMKNKDRKSRFFDKTFLLVDISMDVTFEIFFFILSNVDVNFTDQKLISRLYIIAKLICIIQRLELAGKKEFVVAILDLEDKIFVIHFAPHVNSNSDIHPSHQAWITFLKADKAIIAVLLEYIDFADIFLQI